jgi:replication-associated recombination protein RarA
VGDYLDDVVGQDTAKKFIRTTIKKNNLYNFLFIGPRGVGKRMFGFALAKTLDCPPKSPNFHLIAPIPSRLKDKSDKIYEYSKNYLPENIVVDVADRASILIEQIRMLTERLMHMPESGTKRVVLILEADQMTDEAANCFLKTLEEPPLDTVFILTSSRPEFVLPTIRSRCRVVPFTHLGRAQIEKIVYEGKDEFMLGSPGEILDLRQSGMVENVMDVFKRTPLQMKNAAIVAREYERKNMVELYYPLLLLYRLVLYRKLNLVSDTRYEFEIAKKAKRVTLDRVIDTIIMLNENICLLERNPNKLLHLFNALLKLP